MQIYFRFIFYGESLVDASVRRILRNINSQLQAGYRRQPLFSEP